MHPSHLLPKICNTTLPHKSSPIYMNRMISSPFKNAKPQQILLYKFFFISLFFHVIFIYLDLFIYCFIIIIFLWIFIPFFPKTWNSSPKLKNNSPAFGANDKRIDAPVFNRIIKDNEVCLCHVWIRLINAYLLCARELWQNNALALQFWHLSNALTLWVRVFDTSKSQRMCVISKQFSCKRKNALINL